MRTLRLVFPALVAFGAFAACGGGDGLVPSDAGPGSGGAVGSGGALPGSGGATPGSGGEGLGGDGLGGIGGQQLSSGGSDNGSGGSGNSGCTPRVHLLIQRSGAMFEQPSPEGRWWGAVEDALVGDGALVSEFGDQIELSASVYSRAANDEMCPVGAELDAPVSSDDLADALEEEAAEFEQLATDVVKVDAPVAAAVEGAAATLGEAGSAYIVLVTAGLPDGCEEADSRCQVDEVFQAVQAAHASGIQTRLLFLDASTDEGSYPQGAANAGVGLGVADPVFGECQTDFEYSNSPGSAPFGAPAGAGEVEDALREILEGIAATCD